jgi:pimeloyl-ACP methyl ester carboxylesterase
MKVLVNGQLIEYRKEGGGPAVLLLHGWGATLGTFDQLATHLVGTGHTVYRFDFPGFGASPQPETAWSVGEYVELTAAFIKKMKPKKLKAVVGHSFGGRVIIKGVATGALNPEQVVLMAAAGIRPRPTFKKAAFTAIAKTGKAVTALPGLAGVRQKLQKKLYAAAGSSDYLQAGAMQHIFLNTIKEDLTEYLDDITRPTLLVWGEHDTETPLSDGKVMQQRIADAELVVVPQAGHFVYDDDFGASIAAIDRFLA